MAGRNRRRDRGRRRNDALATDQHDVSQSQLQDIDRPDKAGDLEPPPYDASNLVVFVVTEVFIPKTVGIEPNDAGVRTLGVFTNVDEANDFAEEHVKHLEHLTRREPNNQEDDDGFRGRYQNTRPPSIGQDGEKEWFVSWQSLTMVSVEAQVVYDRADSVPERLEPMSGFAGGGAVENDDDENEDDPRYETESNQ